MTRWQIPIQTDDNNYDEDDVAKMLNEIWVMVYNLIDSKDEFKSILCANVWLQIYWKWHRSFKKKNNHHHRYVECEIWNNERKEKKNSICEMLSNFMCNHGQKINDCKVNGETCLFGIHLK